MRRLIRPGRFAALAVLLAAFVILYATGLYKLQIVEGKIYSDVSQNNIVTEQTVPAARGNILDRYGRLLVSDRACNDLVLNTDLLYAGGADRDGTANAAILEMVNTVLSCGDSYNDTLPVTREPPFEYIGDMTDAQRTILNAYLKEHNLGADSTAVELMAYFRSRYAIDNKYDAKDMRTIAGVRYETNSRGLTTVSPPPYIFASDVSLKTITTLMESGARSFEVRQSYVREYDTPYAAQVLGYVGQMSPEQYNGTDTDPGYKDQGYAMDAIVGQDGAELAFESYLHGTDGAAAETRTADGTLVNTVYTKAPAPGNNAYLTIDIGLQAAAETALATRIAELNAARETQNAQYAASGQTDKIMQDSEGGAVVAIDIKTGEPLCIASYPTFDPSRYITDMQSLLKDPNSPLMNRALTGRYPPGSTFKPITGLAALSTLDWLSTSYTIYDAHTFMKYADEGYAPTCWSPVSHGDENMTRAIRDSCNYYFYSVGDATGIDAIAATAKQFGLGELTGIELPENAGQMASPATKAASHPKGDVEGKWYAGDTLSAAIGQSISVFTPIQLANYTAALASDGAHNKVSLLQSVSSYDYSQKLYAHSPELLNTCTYDLSYYQAIQEGMRLVVTSSASPTVRDAFASADYTAAAKTGTAQLGPGQTDNGVFICYAPYDDPEIAVAVAVEKGGSGAALAEIARAVLDYYFDAKDSAAPVDQELMLLQ